MGRSVNSALIGLGLAACVTACAEDTPEIAIMFNQPFTDDCEAPGAGAGLAQSYISRGTLDLFITDSYVMAPRIESRLVPSGSVRVGSGSAAGGGIVGAEWEANDVSLRRAVIRYEVPDALGVAVASETVREVSGTITPGGVASVVLEAIPDAIGRNLANSRILRQGRTGVTINLRIKYFGVTNSGREVDSNEFVYPIELCYGCLLEIPPSAIDFTYPVIPNCRELNTEGETSICLPGQDGTVDCRNICPFVTAIPGGDPEGICEPVSTL